MIILKYFFFFYLANALWYDRFRCIESGMNDFVPKPAKKEDIREALMRYLTRNSAAATKNNNQHPHQSHQSRPSLSTSTSSTNVNGGYGSTI
jgi:DNA-binding response OmpR family regulator